MNSLPLQVLYEAYSMRMLNTQSQKLTDYTGIAVHQSHKTSYRILNLLVRFTARNMSIP